MKREIACILALVLSAPHGLAQGSDCASATPIAGAGTWAYDLGPDPINVSFDGCGANGGSTGEEVFFAWTAPAAGDYRFQTCATSTGGTTTVGLWSGNDCSATCLTFANSGSCTASPGYQSATAYGLNAGDEILVQLTTCCWLPPGGIGGTWTPPPGAIGDLTIDVAPPIPTNDDCSSPEVIVGTGTFPWNNTQSSNSGFDGAGGAPVCVDPLRDVFFVWSPPTTAEYRFDTCGTSFDTMLAIYIGSDCTAICLDWENDGLCGDDAELVLATLHSTQTYLIQVGGFSSALTGPGVLTIQESDEHNTCSDALPVAGLGAWSIDTSNVASSGLHLGGSSCPGTGNMDVFYSWTALADGDYAFHNYGMGNQVYSTMAIHQGVPCTGASCVGYSGGSSPLGNPIQGNVVVLQGVMAGDVFQIQLNDMVPTDDALLTVEPWFPYDDCGSLLELIGLDVQHTWSPTFATDSGIGQALCSLCHDKDVFFEWVAPCDGTYRMTAEDTTYNIAAFAVFQTTTNCGIGNPVGFGSILWGAITDVTLTGVQAGERYMIQFGVPSFALAGEATLRIHATNSDCGSFTTVCEPAALHHEGGPVDLSGSWVSGPQGVHPHVEASSGPEGEFGFFLLSAGAGASISVFQGTLCLDAPIGRMNLNGANNQGLPQLNSVGQFDASGVLQNLVGTSVTGTGYTVPYELPVPPGPGLMQSGETWYLQLWYRDEDGGGNPTANFSNVIGATIP